MYEVQLLQGFAKETFPGFVKIWCLCYLLCLRLDGQAKKNISKFTQSGKVSSVK